MENEDLLKDLYDAFNRRDVDAILPVLHANVDWPNGWEGGRVEGREAVRDYWTRQWAEIDPRVDPVAFAPDENGRVVVRVHQVVRDLDGNLAADLFVHHAYTFEDGLVRRMEIEPA